MTTPAIQTIWDASILVGCRTARAYSEDRADERDRELLQTWSAMVRELLAVLSDRGHPTVGEWDAMAPEAMVTACAGMWFDYAHFAFAVQRAVVADALGAIRRN